MDEPRSEPEKPQHPDVTGTGIGEKAAGNHLLTSETYL